VALGETDGKAAPGGGAFPNTRWSLVVQVGGEDDGRARAAMAELCEIYWYPLYAYARRDSKAPEDAADLTQGFFAKLLSEENLKTVRQERGKLRSYLLTGMRNFIISEMRRQSRQKRGGGVPVSSLDLDDAERRYREDIASEHTPETLFERRWAITLLDRAMQRLKGDYLDSERGELFDALQPFIGGGGEGTYAEVGTRLGMTEGAVKVAVHRMRGRYRLRLREEVVNTVADESEVEAEIAYLFSVFS
jgi:RNA polymerase sigma-70 factor (ECF subfamily)